MRTILDFQLGLGYYNITTTVSSPQTLSSLMNSSSARVRSCKQQYVRQMNPLCFSALHPLLFKVLLGLQWRRRVRTLQPDSGISCSATSSNPLYNATASNCSSFAHRLSMNAPSPLSPLLYHNLYLFLLLQNAARRHSSSVSVLFLFLHSLIRY